MKPPAITATLGLSLKEQQVPLPDQNSALVRLKLSALTHRIQLIIRSKPKKLMDFLEFYQRFLSVKEDLEHYVTRQQAIGQYFHQAGTGHNPSGTSGLFPDKTMMLERTLSRLKEELSRITVLFKRIQFNHQPLKGYSPALYLVFVGLENFIRQLEAYKKGFPHVFFPLPLLSAKVSLPGLNLLPSFRLTRDTARLSA